MLVSDDSCFKMLLVSITDLSGCLSTVDDPLEWENVANITPLERIWLRPTLNEVFDMQWSPDSSHLVVGAIDCKVGT